MVTNQCKTKLLFNSKLNIWWSQTDNGYQWKIVGRKLLLGSEDSFNCYLHLLPIFSGNGGWHICKVSPGAWNHSHGSMCCKCKYFIYCHLYVHVHTCLWYIGAPLMNKKKAGLISTLDKKNNLKDLFYTYQSEWV